MRTLICAVLLCASVARADEVYVPATPVPPGGDVVTGYHILEFGIGVPLGDTANARVDVSLVATSAPGVCARKSTGECLKVNVTYTGADAVTLINTLNTANLTTNSLRKRILTKLQTDGHIPAGSISGSAGVPTPIPTPTINIL